MATQAETAKHLIMGVRRFRQLCDMGVFPRPEKKGQWNKRLCREAYIKHLRGVASGHKPENSDLDLTEERARLAREQADGHALKNAELRGELVRLDAVADVVGRDYSNLRTRLLGLPSKMAPEVHLAGSVQETKAVLDRAIREVLTELSNDPGGAIDQESKKRVKG